MKRIYEFVCTEGHNSEAYVDEEYRTIRCRICDNTATRVVSKPLVKLEGVTGSFPGAYHKWERKRNEKIAQERKLSS
jgi:hypothetical protein